MSDRPRQQSLYGIIDPEAYLSFRQPIIARWRINEKGLRHHYRDTDCVLPGTIQFTHTMDGHDVYLQAMVRNGSLIRDLVADSLRFPLVIRAMAGKAAAVALQHWLDNMWDLIVDLQTHRQRLQSWRSPRAVPGHIWEQHVNVWMRFRWEQVVPDDTAVATVVLGHLKLYAYPGFEWQQGPEFMEIQRCLACRQRTPVGRPRETVFVNLSEPEGLRQLNKGPGASLLDFQEDCSHQQRSASSVRSAPTPKLQTGDFEVESTPPTSAHQLWSTHILPPLLRLGPPSRSASHLPPPPPATTATMPPPPLPLASLPPPPPPLVTMPRPLVELPTIHTPPMMPGPSATVTTAQEGQPTSSWTGGWRPRMPLPPPPVVTTYQSPLDYSAGQTLSSSATYQSLQQQPHQQEGQGQAADQTDPGCGLLSTVRSIRKGRGRPRKDAASNKPSPGQPRQRRRRQGEPEANPLLRQQLQAAPTEPLRSAPSPSLSSFRNPAMFLKQEMHCDDSDDDKPLVVDEGRVGKDDLVSMLINAELLKSRTV